MPSSVPGSPQPGVSAAARRRGSGGPGWWTGSLTWKLFVSPLTVRTRVHRVMTKPDARDRAQLVVMAYQSGLVRPPSPETDG